ncbi:hypothetical protein PROFUN_10553 [Planoprotostelium fungivorum]|uniref:Uncharacterized protein n=1 Tax=Planoprotostelium fungivorum TaxID=1890364 RepID=A0A2P6N6T7_9EUKA|nr:hypothetical protein PROFUN_10553 [Planoprotostelium fungivorum]
MALPFFATWIAIAIAVRRCTSNPDAKDHFKQVTSTRDLSEDAINPSKTYYFA